MKKLFTTIFLFAFLMVSVVGVSALETPMRSIEEIVIEIRTDLGIAETEVIDPSLAKIELIEELGDSVMEAYLGNPIMHEQMDEYYGGDESETLTDLHIQIGQDYLNGYPITMRTFMLFDDPDANYPNRSYGNMMGTYDNSNYGKQSNSGFGMMGRNYNSSNGELVYGAPVNNSYGNYGMMNNLGWGGMIMGMLGFILLIVALVYLFSSNSRNQVLPLSNNALNIAKERYARGEITREEFLQITSTLK